MAEPGEPVEIHRRRVDAVVFFAYAAISFAILGLPVLVGAGSRYVGFEYDPQIFIWAFAWLPHALGHHVNPFVSHAVWAPIGLNLAWVTAVPGLAALFLPLTLVVGPIVSYDVAAAAMPALAAWTAYLLCRDLTRQLWPSIVGGYLFGFSSYLIAQDGGGHLNLSAVFTLPLIALLVLRRLDDRLTTRQLVARLGPVLALQVLISTELAFTAMLALVIGLATGFVCDPRRRVAIRASIPGIVGAHLAAGALTAPFVYYLVSDLSAGSIVSPENFNVDLLNLVVPTKIDLIGGRSAASISAHFLTNGSEQGAYLGLPLLLLTVAFFWEERRRPVGRFLAVACGIGLVAAFGSALTIDGRRYLALPWRLVQGLPVFGDVLPGRLVVYVALVSAVASALWVASRRGVLLRAAAPCLCAIALVPDPVSGGFATRYSLPVFFTTPAYRACIHQGETVLALPVRGGWSLLWQVATGDRFSLAGGDVGPRIPAAYQSADADRVTDGNVNTSDKVGALRAFIEEFHVESVVVDPQLAAYWQDALDTFATPHAIGGIVLYRLDNVPPPGCPEG